MAWRQRMHEIIFEADTKEGKLFDVVLLWLIVFSIILLILESVQSYREQYGDLFFQLELIITILFTVEYIARIVSVKNPTNYIFSFYGIVDLLSILPFYIFILTPEYGTQYLISIRTIRLLRLFRILKMPQYILASDNLLNALKASRVSISVFLASVVILTLFLGSVMYVVEGPENGFTNIPRSWYWAIVTLTTVGYGDIAPNTAVGQFIASIVMILGYGIIAVPTGIVTSSMVSHSDDIDMNTQVCHHCNATGHKDDAEYCYNCGFPLTAKGD